MKVIIIHHCKPGFIQVALLCLILSVGASLTLNAQIQKLDFGSLSLPEPDSSKKELIIISGFQAAGSTDSAGIDTSTYETAQVASDLTFDPNRTGVEIDDGELRGNARVVNAGTVFSNPFVRLDLALYTAQSTPIYLGSFWRADFNPLPPGGFYDIPLEVDLTEIDINPGQYLIGFIVDPTQAVPELNENNNLLIRSSPVYTVTEDLPNLAFDPDRSDVEIDGNTVDFELRIVNNGSEDVDDAVASYFIIDNSTEQGAILAEENYGRIRSGRYEDVSLSLDLSGLPAGSYSLGCVLDFEERVTESNEGDNIITLGTFEPGGINLKFDISQSDIDIDGDEIGFEVRVDNEGSIEAEDVKLVYFIEPYPRGSGQLTAISERIELGDIRAGRSEFDRYDIDLGQFNLPEGTYAFGCIIDPDSEIPETTKEDNILLFNEVYDRTNSDPTGRPNLKFSDVGNSLNINQSQLSVSLRVLNEGNDASGQTQIDFFLAPNRQNNEDFFHIGNVAVSSLNSGEGKNISFSTDVCTVLPDLEDGEYILVYVVDLERKIEESNEEDNLGFFQTPVYDHNCNSIPIDQKPNLTVSSAGRSLEIDGNQLKIEVNVLNSGEAAAAASQIGFYLLPNDPNSQEIFFLGVSDVVSLSPGSLDEISFVVDVCEELPDLQTKEYLVAYFVDPNEQIEESDESDNFNGFQSPTFTPDCSDDPPTDGVPNLTFEQDGTSLDVNGSTFKLTVLVVNTGEGTSPETEIAYFLVPVDTAENDIYAFDELREVKSLKAGERIDIVFEADIEAADLQNLDNPMESLLSGEYQIAFWIDPFGNISEMDDDDNIAGFSAPTVTDINGEIMSKLNVYPNPATKLLQVQLEQGINEKLNLSIFSLTGQELYRHPELQAGTTQIQLDVEAMPAGFYFLKIVAGDEQVTRKIQIIK